MKQIQLFILLLFSFNAIFSQNLELDWVNTLGKGFPDHVDAITKDGAGNIYAVGSFQHTVDFDPGNGSNSITSKGARDVFVTKYDSNGVFIWVNSLGGVGNDYGYDIDLDPEGNVVIGGGQFDSSYFNGSSISQVKTKYSGAFISKFDKNDGHSIWRKTVNSSGSHVFGLECDHLGNVYATGQFSWKTDFDPGVGEFFLQGGFNEMFVLKLNSNGDFVWARLMKGSSHPWQLELGTDRVYISGTFQNQLIVSQDTLSSKGSNDIFILKLNTDGSSVWAKSYGGTSTESNRSLMVDENENIYLGGTFAGTVLFDSTLQSLSASQLTDGYLLKIDKDGKVDWLKQFEGVTVMGIDVNLNNHIFLTGEFSGTVDFDPSSSSDTKTSAGSTDAYVVKLDIQGRYYWSAVFGGVNNEKSWSIAADSADNVVLGGSFYSQTDFTPGVVGGSKTSLGSDDGFVVKYSPSTCSKFNVLIDSIVPINCLTKGSVNLSIDGGRAPFTYKWNDSLTSTLDTVVSIPTAFSFFAVDSNNCQESFSVEVVRIDSFDVTVPSISSWVCGSTAFVNFPQTPDSVIWDHGYKGFSVPFYKTGTHFFTAYDKECPFPGKIDVQELLAADTSKFMVHIDDTLLANTINFNVSFLDSTGSILATATQYNYEQFGYSHGISLGDVKYTVRVSSNDNPALAQDYFITYSDSSYTLGEARYTYVKCDSNEVLHVYLKKKPILAGNFSLSGHIWLADSTNSMCSGYGAVGLNLILLNEKNQAVDQVDVAPDGSFEFKQLDNGNYRVFGNKKSGSNIIFDNTNASVFQISNSSITGINLLQQGNEILNCGAITSIGSEQAFEPINVYIGTGNELVIEGVRRHGELTVLSITGAVMFSRKLKEGSNVFLVNGLSAGVYFVVCNYGGVITSKKILFK